MEETNRDISPIIYGAIKRLQNSFGGTKVKLLSEKMYRRTPDEYCALGNLGVDIEIEGIKTFLGCELHAEDIACTPYGQMIADEFVFKIIHFVHPELFEDTIKIVNLMLK